MEDLLTSKEVAKMLKLSPVTLSNWRRFKPRRLPFVRLDNGRVRYEAATVRMFLATCRQNGPGSSDSDTGETEQGERVT